MRVGSSFTVSYPDPGIELQVFLWCQLIEQNVMLGADSCQPPDLVHLLWISEDFNQYNFSQFRLGEKLESMIVIYVKYS